MLILSCTQCRLEDRGGILFVLASAALPCPVCASLLYTIGNRLRGVIFAGGVKRYVMIRRMRCSNKHCRKIHHELPDVIVPYKRHCAETIENVISDKLESVPCEDSTVWRIGAWWSAMSVYFANILTAFAARLNMNPPERPTFREKIQAAANSQSWTFPGRLSGVPPGVSSQPVRQ